MEIKVQVNIVVEEDDGCFYAHCPDLKGVHVSGESVEDALQNAVQAVQLYVSSLMKHDEPIPVGVLERPTMKQQVGDLIAAFMHHTPQTFVKEIAVPA